MSSAAMAIQQAVILALASHTSLATKLSGVFDGPPVRAAMPWAGVDCGTVTDWSHKSGQGREVRIALSLWSEGAAGLHDMMAEAEAAMENVGLPPGPPHLVSLSFLRSRILRDADGPWLGLLEYRARILA